MKYIFPVEVTLTTSPFWALSFVSLNLAVSSATGISLSNAPFGMLDKESTPEILEAGILSVISAITCL